MKTNQNSDNTNMNLDNQRAQQQVKVDFIINELKKESFEQAKLEDIRSEQFKMIDQSLKGFFGADYYVKHKKFRNLVIAIEKASKLKQGIVKRIKFYYYTSRARRFVNRGKYFFAQQVFGKVRDGYQQTKEDVEWYK